MTRDEILNMPAGREMDELIALHVFGYQKEKWEPLPYIKDGKTRYRFFEGDLVRYLDEDMPFYSKDIAAAWEVIERIKGIDKFWSPGIHWDDDDGECNPEWLASFNYFGNDEKDYRFEEAWGKSAPLAICRAALLVVLELK